MKIPQTLSFRLTLWYSIIFTLSSGAVFLFFYIFMTTILQEQTDRELTSRLGTFASVFKARGDDAVRRVMVLEAQAAGERKVFFRLLSIGGRAFSSSSMSYWQNLSVSTAAIRELLEGSPRRFETVLIPEQQHHIRVLYGVIGPGVILQIGQTMDHNTRFIEAFRKILAGTLAVIIMGAALIGGFMARKALSGLDEVTRIAMSISGKDLHLRVPLKHRGDEIDRLAATFNQMLDRIESLVSGIREMNDNIAHDLKSPVTRIRGIAEITLTTGRNIDEYEHMAANTIEECDRLLYMINTMLMISKTETGAEAVLYETVDMAALLREICELYQPFAEDNGIRIVCRVPEYCVIHGDAHLIRRMAANLMDNAVKYTPSGGHVLAGLVCLDGVHAELFVEDTGIGIPEKDLPHIFKRFYRCDPSRSKAGTGLGLSLACAIAGAHGGNIAVSSSPGEGTAFMVSLAFSNDAFL